MNYFRKLNSSHSNTSKARLTSKDRKASMNRLGIKNNLPKKKKPLPSVDEEKRRIQIFLDSFFKNESNANKFSEIEKRKFAMNFKKAYIENQYGEKAETKKKKNTPKLKALPAPPMVNTVTEKPPLKEILPLQSEIEEYKEIKEESSGAAPEIQGEPGQKLGNTKLYTNVFKNNFNFISKNENKTDSVFDQESQYKFTEENNEFSVETPNQMKCENSYSLNSEEK